MNRGRTRKRVSLDDDSGGDDGISCFLHDHNGGGKCSSQACSKNNFVSLEHVRGDPQEKLNYLLKIKSDRLALPADSPYRMEAICLQIPTTLVGIDTPTTGYHSDCYGNFTKHLDRVAKLLASLEPMASTPRHSPRKKSSPVKSPLSPQTRLFPEKCIFCRSKWKRVPTDTRYGGSVPCKPFPAPFKGRDPPWREQYMLL